MPKSNKPDKRAGVLVGVGEPHILIRALDEDNDLYTVGVRFAMDSEGAFDTESVGMPLEAARAIAIMLSEKTGLAYNYE
jgi:hypothetical protein